MNDERQLKSGGSYSESTLKTYIKVKVIGADSPIRHICQNNL